MAASPTCSLFEQMTAPLLEAAHDRRLSTAADRWKLEEMILYTLGMVRSVKLTRCAADRRERLLILKGLVELLISMADECQRTTGQSVAHFNDIQIARYAVDVELKATGVVGKTWDITEEEAEGLDRLVNSFEPGPGRLDFVPRPATVGSRSLLN